MKKIVLLTVALALIMFMIGCDDTTDTPVSAPQNLSITGNSLTVTLNWDASPTEAETDGIDGYAIFFDGIEVGDVASGVYSFAHTPSTVGTYSVVAYRGSEESSMSAAQVSTDPVAGTGSFYGFSTPNESGFGWNVTTGAAMMLSATEANADNIDFIFDDNTYFGIGNQLYSVDAFWDAYASNGILISSTVYASLTEAAASGEYYNYEELIDGETYMFKLDEGTNTYYGKLRITSWADGMVTFEYTIQLIGNYRRLG